MDYSFREEIYSLKKTPMVEMYNLAKKHMGLDDKLINFASGHPSEDSKIFNRSDRVW